MRADTPENLFQDGAPGQGGKEDAAFKSHPEPDRLFSQSDSPFASPNETGAIYTHIALSLARGYTSLYYVDMESGDYIELHTDDKSGLLVETSRGKDLFGEWEENAGLFVYPDDRESFLEVMSREFLEEALAQSRVYELIYRKMSDGVPSYVEMRISRMEGDGNHLVLAVSDIDEQMRQRKAEERLIEERIVYARLHALTGNFIVVYVVDLETENYREFSSTAVYEEDLAQAKEGSDFFETVREAALVHNYPDDIEPFLSAFTKENVLAKVARSGIFTFGYRLYMEGRPIHVQLKAAMVEEREGLRLIVGLNDVDAQVRQAEETARRLDEAQAQAHIDALTGAYNKHAYLKSESGMDTKINERRQEPFSVTICDVNDLKRVNDTQGHRAGDDYIREAYRIICSIFSHSSVFRTGGDEFTVISQGSDFDNIEELVWQISTHNARALREGGVVIACGMSKFSGDSCVEEVFERADQDMYGNKSSLKTVASELSIVRSGWSGAPDGAENARHDYLTGLLTMSAFLELAEQSRDDILARGGSPAMLYMDFAGMRFINTKYGFAEGDRVLKEFALLLIRSFGRHNCCRIGADHFAAVCDENGLEHKLRHIFREYAEMCNRRTPPVRVGIYPNRIEQVDVSAACDRAKTACNALRGLYSSEFAFYDDALRAENVMKQYAIEHLDDAMGQGRFQVYLQPIVRSVNEKVCDVEALVRWEDPEKGLISPAEFVPVLEEIGLIYKLDLYMLDQVLAFIKEQKESGEVVVPCSINLSRSDFSTCDIVEEIRRRVDAAGVGRDMVAIEVTESIVGANFDFIKEQIARFQSLGFAVWMDDFGSGYSSFDLLQSIKFDLIKLDIAFMRKFYEGESSKIVMTDLMRMATSLGVDTLCEGVETEDQVRFLQEIGCSKLQGFYYSKPLSLDEIRRRRNDGEAFENENPEETGYYESIGKVNLYDLAVIAQEDKNSIQNAFDTLPMGVIEVKGDATRWIRSNQSYRDFAKRFFGMELSRLGNEFVRYKTGFMSHIVQTCIKRGERSFFNERMPDGSIVHSFARPISTNPVTGVSAVVVAVLSITKADEAANYADLARALSKDYYTIYVVDVEDDTYIEYSSLEGGEELTLESHGANFFASTELEALARVDKRDREFFLKRFSKERVLSELSQKGVFNIAYRLIETGKPMFVNMKVSRLDSHRLILGISVIDALMKQREETERLRRDRAELGRIAALSDEFAVLYAIDAETGRYIQYNPSREFEKFGLATQGEDFFGDVISDAPKLIPPEDIERYLAMMSETNILGEIRERGRFIYEYRMMIDGKIVPARLKATLVEEDGMEKIILGIMSEMGPDSKHIA